MLDGRQTAAPPLGVSSWSGQVAPLRVLALAAAVVVAAGSVGPWLIAGAVEMDGLAGGLDGRWTLVAGFVAILAFAPHPRLGLGSTTLLSWLGLAALAAAAALGTVRWLDLAAGLEPLGAEPFVEVGWGLRLVTAAGWGGGLIALAHALRGVEPAARA